MQNHTTETPSSRPQHFAPERLSLAHLARLAQYLWLPLLVLLLHFVLALLFNAYERFEQTDVPMHFAGGFAIAYWVSHMLLYGRRQRLLRLSGRFVLVLAVLGAVGTATVLWEFVEFFADTFFDAGAQISIQNVMKDQLMGLLGGLSYVIWQKPHRAIPSSEPAAE